MTGRRPIRVALAAGAGACLLAVGGCGGGAEQSERPTARTEPDQPEFRPPAIAGPLVIGPAICGEVPGHAVTMRAPVSNTGPAPLRVRLGASTELVELDGEQHPRYSLDYGLFRSECGEQVASSG